MPSFELPDPKVVAINFVLWLQAIANNPSFLEFMLLWRDKEPSASWVFLACALAFRLVMDFPKLRAMHREALRLAHMQVAEKKKRLKNAEKANNPANS